MPYIKGKYFTESEVEQAMKNLSSYEREELRKHVKSSSSNSSSDGDFLTSAVIGAVTGSSILGGLLGGDMVGGLLGDAFEGTDDSWF